MKPFTLIKLENIVTFLRLRLFVLLPGLLLCGLLSAQVKFSTVVNSREIGMGDYVQIEFVVENAKTIDNLTPPAFSDFQVLRGPNQSSSMSIDNGNITQFKSVSYVLQPTKKGKFIIGGATATVDGKPMRSEPVTIVVKSKGQASTNPNLPVPGIWPEPLDLGRDYTLKPGENIADKIRKNLFVKVLVNKTSCYVGEPIMATYKLYSRLQSESKVTKFPSLNGFSVYDMMDPNSDVSSIETVNGKPFTVHTIRKTQLIPLQAGRIELDPVEVENTVHFIKLKGKQDPQRHSPLEELFSQFSDEIQGEPLEQHITLDTKAVGITVKPLPTEKRPSSFNGAVGRFAINAVFDNKNIAAEDAVILKVTVKGNGNLPVVNAPSIQWPANFESYDPSTKEDIDKTVFPLGGSKTFAYSFIPKSKGEYTIPPIEISYFDPVTQSYKSVQSQPLRVKIAARKKATLSHQISAVPAATEKKKGFSDFLQDHLEWLFAILIFSALAFYLGLRNRQLKKPVSSAGPELLKPAEQPVIVVDPLKKARELLKTGDYKNFYSELNRAIWKAAADNLELPSSELNKQNIIFQLKARGIDEETTLLFSKILNECEMNLYTPSYDIHDMEALLSQAELFSDRTG